MLREGSAEPCPGAASSLAGTLTFSQQRKPPLRSPSKAIVLPAFMRRMMPALPSKLPAAKSLPRQHSHPSYPSYPTHRSYSEPSQVGNEPLLPLLGYHPRPLSCHSQLKRPKRRNKCKNGEKIAWLLGSADMTPYSRLPAPCLRRHNTPDTKSPRGLERNRLWKSLSCS